MPPTELAREEEKFLALTVLAPIFGRAWTDRISLLLLDSPTELEMDPGRASWLPDCSSATCPSVCECSLEKCALPAMNCQFNAACREFAECSLTCTCGDTACAEACAEEHDSKQTVNMLECLVEKCDARREVEPLPDSSATRDLQVPDCNEAGCSSVCNCAVESCTLPALNCNFNPVCKQFAECAFQLTVLAETTQTETTQLAQEEDLEDTAPPEAARKKRRRW